MRTAIVQNGLFEVNEVGEVYRIKGDQKELAAQYKTGRNRRYRTVSAMVNGKQKHFLVHRLVAEGFIPNPKNLPEINHIDGNPANNRVENLEWCTRGANAQHAYRTGLINPYRNAKPCRVCGELTNARDGICAACKPQLRKEAHAEDKAANLRDLMMSIDRSKLTPNEIKYVDLREQGLSLQQIADLTGVTRQRVDYAIKKALFKNAMPPKQNAAVRKKIIQLESQITRKQATLERIESEKRQVIEQIKSIETALSLLSGAD